MSDCNCGHYDCVDCLQSIVVKVEAEIDRLRGVIRAHTRRSDEYVEMLWELQLTINESKAERDALREAQRWVPVSERLPEEETPVLVIGKAGEHRYLTTAMVIYEDDGDGHAGWVWCQLCDNYNPNLWDKGAYMFDDDYQYTHWMPLPLPPTKE